MKYILLLLLMPINLLAQDTFELTPEGFRSSTSPDKSYVVLDFPGKSKDSLYKMMKAYVTKTYVSPKDVLSENAPESMTVKGFEKNEISRNGLHHFDLDYSLHFEFRDGKIKVNDPHFTLTAFNNMKRQTLHLVANNSFDGSDLGIYNKKHKLNSSRAKKDLETFFNNRILLLVKDLLAAPAEW